MAFFAGTREAIDNDYNEYSRLFKESVLFGFQAGYEVVFYILPKILNEITSQYYVELTFLLIAFIGVGTKLIAIKDSKYFSVCLLIYLTNHFFAQDMTTIRAGVSSGIFLLMIKDINENKNTSFFIKLAIALLFHYSSFLFLLIWISNKREIALKYYIFALVISMFLLLVNFDILTMLRLDFFFPKIKVYIDANDDINLNVFNFKILLALFYLVLFLVFYKKNRNNTRFVFLLKTHILSIILFYLFAKTNIVFSLRSFELLSIIQIMLLPYLISFFPTNLKALGYVMILVGSIVSFYYIIFISGNFKEYSSWLM